MTQRRGIDFGPLNSYEGALLADSATFIAEGTLAHKRIWLLAEHGREEAADRHIQRRGGSIQRHATVIRH